MMNNRLLFHIGITSILALCSCRLSEKADWGDCVAEVELKTPSGVYWNMSELQEKDNEFIMTIRVNAPVPEKIKPIKLSDKQSFVINLINDNYYLFDYDNGVNSSVLKHQNENKKILWKKQFNSTIIPPNLIYNSNNNLLFLAVLLLNDNYTPDRILILDPQDGKTLKLFTLDKMFEPQVPLSINMSDNFNFLIIAEYVQHMSLEQHFLIFKREQEKTNFKYTGHISLPKNLHDGMLPDNIKINNDVAIISMQKGRRSNLVASQKIIFFDLKSNSVILEYSFVSNDRISDAVITADRKYIAFIVTRGWTSFVRLYKLKE